MSTINKFVKRHAEKASATGISDFNRYMKMLATNNCLLNSLVV